MDFGLLENVARKEKEAERTLVLIDSVTAMSDNEWLEEDLEGMGLEVSSRS